MATTNNRGDYTTTLLIERTGPGEDDYAEHEVEVSGNYEPGERGCRRGDPGDWTPDEPASVELVSATVDGQPFELTDDEEDAAREALLETVSGDYKDRRTEARLSARGDW